jgi:hypothetical protein
MDIVQVVHDEKQALARIAGTQPPKGVADLDDAFSPSGTTKIRSVRGRR